MLPEMGDVERKTISMIVDVPGHHTYNLNELILDADWSHECKVYNARRFRDLDLEKLWPEEAGPAGRSRSSRRVPMTL